MSSNQDTRVQVVDSDELNRSTDRMERHPGISFKELVGPDSPMASAGPIIGIYDAHVPPSDDYWPRANERNVDRLVYVQKGKGRLKVGDDHYTLENGDLARIHQGEDKEARIDNHSEEHLHLFIIIFQLG